MTIAMKIRRKYMVGKVPGNPCKARTNNKEPISIGKALFAQWLGVTANRDLHKARVAKLAAASAPLLDRKGGKVVGYMTRKELSAIWGRK